jgi:hypothetical protein
MHRLSFFAALALLLGGMQTMACQNAGCAMDDKLAPAECNSIGCVRPTNAFEKLARTAERTLSEMRVPEPGRALNLCDTGNCAIETTATPLPKSCGSAGCATPEPKRHSTAVMASHGGSADISTLVTDAFAAVTERPMRPPPAVQWAEWSQRWGFGALYKGY